KGRIGQGMHPAESHARQAAALELVEQGLAAFRTHQHAAAPVRANHRASGIYRRGHSRLPITSIVVWERVPGGALTVPSVANESFRTSFLAGFAGFLLTLGATGRGHLRGRTDRNEPALLTLLPDDHPEVVDRMTADFEQLLQGTAVLQQHAGGQR